MVTRGIRLSALIGLIGLWPWHDAQAQSTTLASEQLRGAPQETPGRRVGVYLWVDDRVVHVRWSSGGEPSLFSGAVLLDRQPEAVTRFNTMAGGWVSAQEDHRVLFSATAVRDVDGFDLLLPAATEMTLQVELDGRPADATVLFLGEKMTSPPRLPLRFRV